MIHNRPLVLLPKDAINWFTEEFLKKIEQLGGCKESKEISVPLKINAFCFSNEFIWVHANIFVFR